MCSGVRQPGLATLEFVTTGKLHDLPGPEFPCVQNKLKNVASYLSRRGCAL